MSDQEKREQEILNQEMSADEMDTVAGGGCTWGNYIDKLIEFDNAPRMDRCLHNSDHPRGCAATVEDGSWCKDNDACHKNQMVYVDMEDCSKAWQ